MLDFDWEDTILFDKRKSGVEYAHRKNENDYK